MMALDATRILIWALLSPLPSSAGEMPQEVPPPGGGGVMSDTSVIESASWSRL